ncbi:MAG: hypothetical protein GF414_08530 [Candidatus Altiarchaeales archaeon]|nr:hypothetical protein [Candidatus Altiarchaeales archaeon]
MRILTACGCKDKEETIETSLGQFPFYPELVFVGAIRCLQCGEQVVPVSYEGTEFETEWAERQVFEVKPPRPKVPVRKYKDGGPPRDIILHP